MTLNLDPRQRAMLQEMGVRVWQPVATADMAEMAAEVVEVVAQGNVAQVPGVPSGAIGSRATLADATRAEALKAIKLPMPQATVPLPQSQPQPAVQDTNEGGGTPVGDLSALDWPALAHTVAQCHACALCTGRKAVVFKGLEVSQQADWLVLGEPPDEMEERAGQPAVEQAGQLLDNMLRAVGVRRATPEARAPAQTAYLSAVVKCRPAQVRNPDAAELATCRAYLAREVALAQPKVIVAMGRFAAMSLLQGSTSGAATTPLGRLRGQVYRFQGVPVVVTYAPTYLLRTAQDKARAWADLCLALSVVQEAADTVPGQ